MSPPGPKFTPLQGQYLAFIATYERLHDQAPAEADLQAGRVGRGPQQEPGPLPRRHARHDQLRRDRRQPPPT